MSPNPTGSYSAIPPIIFDMVSGYNGGLRLLLRTSGLAALVSLLYRIPFLISSLILYVSSFFSLSLAAILASALGLTAMVL